MSNIVVPYHFTICRGERTSPDKKTVREMEKNDSRFIGDKLGRFTNRKERKSSYFKDFSTYDILSENEM